MRVAAKGLLQQIGTVVWYDDQQLLQPSGEAG